MDTPAVTEHGFAALFVLAILLAPSITQAEDYEVVPGMVVVPDQRLATMHGKYVASTTQVLYFGVQMQSNWAVPNGSMLSAGANVSVNLTQATPTVSFVPTVNVVANDNGYVLTDTSQRTITNDGIDNVSGVTQSIQSTGDYNSTENLTRVTYLSEIPENEAVIGSIDPISVDGMTASSRLDDNSATVSLEVDGQGVAQQTIRGSTPGSTGKGTFQTIVVLGDHHTISNQLDMGVVMGNASESALLQQGVGSAIGTLRGLAPGM